MNSDYDSDSDLSCSSSGSDSSSVFEEGGDPHQPHPNQPLSNHHHHQHLLSPPPPLSTPTATGERDTPLRQRAPARSRSSSFASPNLVPASSSLRPPSNSRSSRTGSFSLLDTHHHNHNHNHPPPGTPESSSNQGVLLTPTSSHGDLLLGNTPSTATPTTIPTTTTTIPRSGSRPNSNPRHRTPTTRTVRHHTPTPVLGPVNRSTIASEERASSHERASRSGTPSSSTHRSSSRGNGNVDRERDRDRPLQSRIVGLGANLAVGTVLRGGTLSALHEQRHTSSTNHTTHHHYQPKSAKQGPGQRKIRRWNNDKFIGIASDISNSLALHQNPQRGMRIANIYAEAEMDKGNYTIPHNPRGNRTIFGTLVSANRGLDLDHPDLDRDPGERSEEDEEDDECVKVKLNAAQLARIRQRFIDGEVGDETTRDMTSSAKERMQRRQDELYKDGHRMMKKNVNPRLLKVVMRACKSSGFTTTVVGAFEKLLVSLRQEEIEDDEEEEEDHGAGASAAALAAVKVDLELWNKILVQKPFLTRKVHPDTGERTMTVRMLFRDDDGEGTNTNTNTNTNANRNSSSSSSKGAFHRLLLHAVCQFHGLDTASSTTSRGHRMMTVTGRCKGSQLRFLDYVPWDGHGHGHGHEHALDGNLAGGGEEKEEKEEHHPPSSLVTSATSNTTNVPLDQLAALTVS